MADKPQPDEKRLGLDDFQELPSDEPGLSLDELTRAYADLIARGDDPYCEVPKREAVPDAIAAEDVPEDSAVDEAEEPTAAADGTCEISPRTILESMLFVGHPENRPLTSEKVASLMRGVRPQEIDELVVELNRSYDEQACPYRVASDGPGYRLMLREEFHSLRDRFYGRVKAARLSQAAIDILAIVAYKQPLTREEVDALRGKPSGSILNQLVRRQLLRIERPHDKPRKPQFSTTERFLALFGLESLRDLPQSPE